MKSSEFNEIMEISKEIGELEHTKEAMVFEILQRYARIYCSHYSGSAVRLRAEVYESLEYVLEIINPHIRRDTEEAVGGYFCGYPSRHLSEVWLRNHAGMSINIRYVEEFPPMRETEWWLKWEVRHGEV